MIKVERLKNKLKITVNNLPENEFKKVIRKIKRLDESYYLKQLNCWIAPLTENNSNLMKRYNFEQYNKMIISTPEDENKWKLIFPKEYNYLKPFQKDGVSLINFFNGRVILGDDMGLGKTVQSLSYVNLFGLYPVLIICPSSVKLHWYEEFLKFTKRKGYIINGRDNPFIPVSPIYIINYEILEHNHEILKTIRQKTLIIDEIHYTKNNKTQRAKVVHDLAKDTPKIIGLSGTPILNKPIEVYYPIQIVNPTVFPNWWAFVKRYCGLYKKEVWKYDHKEKKSKKKLFNCYDGSSNEAELHEILVKKILIRRRKDEVKEQLPDKIVTIIPTPKGEKIETMINWIDNFLLSEEKLIVMTMTHEMIDLLYEKYKKIAVKRDGRTPAKDRDIIKQKFIDDPKIKIFFGNIMAVGTGTDGLQKVASTLTFAEISYVPGLNEQVEKRLDRMGQRHIVNIFYFAEKDGKDEKILLSVNRKIKIINSVIDGK